MASTCARTSLGQVTCEGISRRSSVLPVALARHTTAKLPSRGSVAAQAAVPSRPAGGGGARLPPNSGGGGASSSGSSGSSSDGDDEVTLSSLFPYLLLWSGLCAAAYFVNGKYVATPAPIASKPCCSGKVAAAVKAKGKK